MVGGGGVGLEGGKSHCFVHPFVHPLPCVQEISESN